MKLIDIFVVEYYNFQVYFIKIIIQKDMQIDRDR